jgi:hypothetical protein
MPTASWHASLPQKFGPPQSEKPIDGRAMFQPDAGPVHVARQYTAEPRLINVSIRMSQSQWTLLYGTFYKTTLAGGVREFEWSNPWPGAGTVTFRFAEPPSVEWDRKKMNLPAAYLASSTSNPQRTGMVTLSLIMLPWWPAVG